MIAYSFVMVMPLMPLPLFVPATIVTLVVADPGFVQVSRTWFAKTLGSEVMPRLALPSAEISTYVIVMFALPPPTSAARSSVYCEPTGTGMQVVPRTFISTWKASM